MINLWRIFCFIWGDEYSGYKKGGRAGYANGDVILPQPKPRYFERGDGSTRGMMEAARGMMGVNQNDPRYQAYGNELGNRKPLKFILNLNL